MNIQAIIRDIRTWNHIKHYSVRGLFWWSKNFVHHKWLNTKIGKRGEVSSGVDWITINTTWFIKRGKTARQIKRCVITMVYNLYTDLVLRGWCREKYTCVFFPCMQTILGYHHSCDGWEQKISTEYLIYILVRPCNTTSHRYFLSTYHNISQVFVRSNFSWTPRVDCIEYSGMGVTIIISRTQ